MTGNIFHAINCKKPLCKPDVAHATNWQTGGNNVKLEEESGTEWDC